MGYSDGPALELGDTCHFFGCYSYTFVWFDANLKKNSITYTFTFNETTCIIGECRINLS